MSEQSGPSIFNDRYEIVRELARGGMAEVYLGRDLLLDRPVALKVLARELSRDQAFVERFRREAQAAANLNHPNVVNIYDWGEADGSYFIVMEYVGGRTLSQLIRSEGSLSPERSATIGAEIAAALAFAHRNGVIHRDVKPGNVLIDEEDRVKVTDFGIARATRGTDENLTQTGAVLGTATYFSPEQAEGAGVDGRSDVYSLGVVLYEMCTGQPPFTGDNPVSIAYQHVREQPELPSRRNPAVPPALEAVIMQAMAKDPDRRYQSAQSLRADLMRFVQGRQVEAADPATVMAPALATQLGPAVGATRVGRVITQETAIGGGPPPPQRSRAGAFLALLAILLLVLGLVLYFVGHNLGLFGSSGGSVAVPSVLGQTAAQANAAVQDAGLNPKDVVQANPGGTPGQVFKQDPTAGTNVSKGSTITLFVAQGGTVRVPDVTGQNYNQASQVLTQDGLQVQVTNQASDSASPGTVIAENPAPGQSVQTGSTVTLTVSSGAASVIVPNVIGEPQTQASNTLGQAGLSVSVQSQPDGNVPQGDVISTSPAPGTSVPKGSAVTMVVSSGSPPSTTTSSTSTTLPVTTTLPTSTTTTTTFPTTTTTTSGSTRP